MTDQKRHSSPTVSPGGDKLRQRDEEAAGDENLFAYETLSPEKSKQLLYELRVHQIELQMQNEELRRMQHHLEIQRERYFDLYDMAPVGYLTLNAQGEILEANLTAASMLGMTRNELRNRSITSYIHPEDQDLYYLHGTRLREAIESQTFELRMVRTDATPFWAHLQVALADNGEYRITFSDVSTQKLSEEESRKLEAQLQQAQRMESVGRLAGGVAHDFNNKLTVILGHAELALSRIDPSSPVNDDLIEIKTAAERSADLTRQLLAFARKQIISPVLLDLNETVASMLKMLQRLIGEDIHLNWHPAPNLWPVKIDPSQIDRILANLCVNARDSIADVGKITIETENCVIDTEFCSHNPELIPGEYVRLTVSDDGCGMDKETLSHIFEPFFTTKDPGEGTGLGLATLYGIVRQNKGFTNVYSEPGVGTSFSIYLPRYADSTILFTQAEVAPETARRGAETILLVEDESSILKLTTILLTRQGYKVLAANGPGEAMRLASGYPGVIDLLMTDVVMPGMNGRDLAKSLQTQFPQLKCLYMSGYTADVIATHGILDSGMHFIQKPFTLTLLAAKVRELLDSEG